MHRYVNLDGGEHTKWRKIIRRSQATIKRKMKKTGAPAAAVKPKIEELFQPLSLGQGLRITWLGHSGWLLQTAGASIFIDPVMGRGVNAFIRKKAVFKSKLLKFLPTSAVLISHDHYDHLQVKFLKKVGAKVIAGTGMKKFLNGKKLPAEELKWWETTQIGPAKITFLPSKHGSQRGLLDMNLRLWGGFMIETPDIRIYHAGDSAYCDIFKIIATSFKKVDIALLPIGCYGPESSRTKDHMTPEQAVKAFLDIKAKIMIPMHWGTYQISDEPLDEPLHRLIKEWRRRQLNDQKLKIMAVGESMYLKK